MRNRTGARIALPPTLLTAVIALTVPGISFSADEERRPVGPGPEAFDDPRAEAEIAAASDRQAAAVAARSEPEAVAERERSRTAYEDLSSGEAKAVARTEFPEFLLAPRIEPLELAPSTELVRYLGTSSALIETTGGGPAGRTLLESTLPLRNANESGDLRPLDGELADRGAHLEPRNAPVEAQLPEHLVDGIELPELGVALAPKDADPAAAVEVVGGDKGFYANSATDTDFLLSPTELGAEAAFVLRSQRSPERHVISLELPAGATLELARDGFGARVVSDGATIATITPPLAFDAEGTYVPVKTEVVGDDLALSIRHRARDLRYPLYLDPYFEEYNFNQSVDCGAPPADYLDHWRPEPGMDGRWGFGCGGSIATQANGGWYYYNANEYRQWVWATPPGTYLERADFFGVDYAHKDADSVCMASGIWAGSTGWWQSGASYAPWVGWTQGPIYDCRAFSWGDISHTVGSSGDPSYAGDAQGADNNAAIFQLYTARSQWMAGNSWHLMRSARFYVGDRHPPTLSSKPPSYTAWVDDTEPGGTTRSHTHTATADDVGLGVNRFEVKTPNFSAPGGKDTAVTNRGCWGTRSNTCRSPWTQSVSYRLKEQGMNTVELRAHDQLGNSSGYSWTQPIDRGAPVVQAPTGSLKANASGIRGDQSYELNVSATDGSAASSASRRSGVKRIEVFVDEDSEGPIYSAEHSDAECNLPGGGCPMSMQRTWQVEPYSLGEGTHTISVVATDALGHRSVEEAQQFTVHVTTDIEPGQLQLVTTPPGIDGSYQLQVTALETRTLDRPVSGMDYAELIVDGLPVDTYQQPCPTGGCDLVRTYQMSASQAPENHEIEVIVYDRAGNGTTKSVGKRGVGYRYFGYNSEFNATLLDRAYEGGANIVRFPIDWCFVAENRAKQSEPLPRDQWSWGFYRDKFRQVKAINERIAGTADDLKVVAVLANSPPWARDNPRDDASCGPLVTPPAPSQITGVDSSWRYFVAEFVRIFGPQADPPDDGVQDGETDFTNSRLVAVELWNEPNLGKFWGSTLGEDFKGDPQRFAHLVNVGSAAVKSNSNLEVFPGGLSPIRKAHPQVKFMERATRLVPEPIEPSRIDGISIHLFADGAPSEKRAIETTDNRYERLVGILSGPIAERPRWITEIGFPSGVPDAGQTLRTQRARLNLAYTHFRRKPNLKAFIVHTLQDGSPKDSGVLNPTDASKCKPVYRDLAEKRGSIGRVRCSS